MPDLVCNGIDVGIATLAELRSCASDINRLAVVTLALLVIGAACMTYGLLFQKGDR